MAWRKQDRGIVGFLDGLSSVLSLLATRSVDLGCCCRRARKVGRNSVVARLVIVDVSAQRDSVRPAYREEDLLTPALAATIADRSVRTIRRAYSVGTLVAYRDGGGRGVRIRYGDLLDWLLRGSAAVAGEDFVPGGPLFAADPSRRVRSSRRSENLALLSAARQRRNGRGGAAARRAEAPSVSSSA